jgi:hypothetical protein
MNSRPRSYGGRKKLIVTAPTWKSGRIADAAGSSPLTDLPNDYRFFATLVFRQVRTTLGSGNRLEHSERAALKPAPPGLSRTEPSPISRPERTLLTAQSGWPEPLQQSLETLLSDLVRRRVLPPPPRRGES